MSSLKVTRHHWLELIGSLSLIHIAKLFFIYRPSPYWVGGDNMSSLFIMSFEVIIFQRQKFPQLMEMRIWLEFTLVLISLQHCFMCNVHPVCVGSLLTGTTIVAYTYNCLSDGNRPPTHTMLWLVSLFSVVWIATIHYTLTKYQHPKKQCGFWSSLGFLLRIPQGSLFACSADFVLGHNLNCCCICTN